MNEISLKPPAALVVIDTSAVSWAPIVEEMLKHDPLVEINLYFVDMIASDRAAQELARREGWSGASARWCIISAEGQVLFSAETMPSPEQIHSAFGGTGLATRLETLRAFLASDPGHAEARLAMLGELKAIAEAKTKAALAANAFGASASQAPPSAGHEPPHELEGILDREIWGQFALEANAAFFAELWKQGGGRFWGPPGAGGMRMGNMGWDAMPSFFLGAGNPLVSLLAPHSPTMKNCYKAWLPAIERAIWMRPSSFNLWDFWLGVQRAAGGGRDMGALKASLVLAPGQSHQAIPPASIQSQWVIDCIASGHWRMAEEVAGEAWESLLAIAASGQTTRAGRRQDASVLNSIAWVAIAEPYLELLLLQNKASSANALIQEWLGHGGSPRVAQRAAQMAKRLGYESYGERWEALAPRR
jgi:hypothetical protein